MSEIKGQLLGIILVLMVFAAVSVGVKAAFNSLTNNVQAEVSEVIANQ